MKPIYAQLIFLKLIFSINVYPSGIPSHSEISHEVTNFNTLIGVDLIVRFSDIFSDFSFYEIQDEFKELGLLLFSTIDNLNKVAAFRPISLSSDSTIIQEIYRISHVDTVYYPLLDQSSRYIYYYDDRKLHVKFDEDIPDSSILQIIKFQNCTVFNDELSDYGFYDLSINDGYYLNNVMNAFAALPEVDWVEHYVFGSGGVYNPECVYIHYLNDSQITYGPDGIYIDMSWGIPSSPCYKVDNLTLHHGDSIDYYPVFYAGPHDRVCDIDEVLYFPLADTAEFTIILHQFILAEYCNVRIIYNKGLITTLGNSSDQSCNANCIKFNVSNELLNVWYSGNDKKIEILEIYTLNGIKKEIIMVKYDSNEYIIKNISDLPNGIYILHVLFDDHTNSYLKFLK